MPVMHPAAHSASSVISADDMVDTEVMYDKEYGVWSSPNVGGLRPVPPVFDMEIPANIRYTEFQRPRWLSNVYPWVAFWPKRVMFTGPLFSRLNYTNATIQRAIVKVSPLHYSLPEDMIQSLQRLENGLVNLTTYLVSESPRLSRMAGLGFLPLPSECGYASKHAEERFVLRCAFKSRDAFVALTAFCSFAIANHMEGADAQGEPAWAYLCRIRKHMHPQWLYDLQQSFVGNFAPGFRSGAYVNGYATTCGCTFPAFKVANVPLWIWWGNNPAPLRDQKLMRKYLPTEREVNQAKQMSNMPYPQHRGVVDDGIHHTRTFDDGNNQAMNIETFDDGNDQAMNIDEGYQPAGRDSLSLTYPPLVNDGGDIGEGQQLTGPSTRSSTNVRSDVASVPAPIRGSFQLHGEDLETFITRMNETLAGARLDEDDDDLESRAESEKQAAVQQKKDTLEEAEDWEIFEWIDAGGGHRLRTLVPKEERQSRWSLTTPAMRWYHGLLGSWSIVVPASASVMYLEPSSTSVEHDDNVVRVGERQPQSSQYPVPKDRHHDQSLVIQPRTLDSVVNVDVYAEDVENVYGNLVRDSPVVSRSLPEILLCRYGFRPRAPYTTDERMRKRETNDEECTVAVSAMERLGLKEFLGNDLQGAVVDLYNYLIGNPAKPVAFHPLWDLHPEFWHLVVHHPKFRHCKVNDDIHLIGTRDKALHLQFYLLMIPQACTVLQIYREGHSGILAIARSLIAWGIPFHTVRCHTHTPMGLGSTGKKSIGLGFRHKDHVFDVKEYAIYEKKKQEILEGCYGRVAAMSGGILWRLSREIVPDKTVTRGPTPSHMREGAVVGSLSGLYLVDDQLSATEEDIICGVYHQSEHRNQISQVSWWPKHSTWIKSGMNVGYWSPDCEAWYQARLRDIRDGTAGPHTASEWKNKLKKRVRNTAMVTAAMNNLANAVLSGEIYYWEAGVVTSEA